MRYLTQYYLGGSIEKVLSTSLVPPDQTLSLGDIVIDRTKAGSTRAAGVSVSLTGGSLRNFNPAFQSMTQGDSGNFVITFMTTGMSAHYSWSEHYELWEGTFDDGPKNGSWPYAMGVDSFTITVPFSLTQQAQSYRLTINKVVATPTGISPNIPADSVVRKEPGSCFTQTVDQATVQALENIDFSSAVQNVLQNLFGTIPASGQLTSDIVFDFNQGDTPLVFSTATGLTLGVTGNTTWKGQAYAGGTPPSLPIPSIPATEHIHLFAADYQFNELYWAFFKDGRLVGGCLIGDIKMQTRIIQMIQSRQVTPESERGKLLLAA